MPDDSSHYQARNIAQNATVLQGENLSLKNITLQFQNMPSAEELKRLLRDIGETDLPSGTVTFVLMQVEDSTRLWEEQPNTMQAAIARYGALMRACVQERAGIVMTDTAEGHCRCAVFARADSAIVAACAFQEAMFAEDWSTTAPLRVRVALHTGDPELHGGGYEGAALGRCAQLRDIANGGQTLLSQTVYGLVRDSLPDGVSLRDMGIHRLKDLAQPEHVYQILHPGLPIEFPPLQSLDVFPNNLPIQPTRFIGRERELSQAKHLLSTNRLLTLTGAGGCGKTRLALQLAADLLKEYSSGVWLVPLASLEDASLVPQTVASALGLREQSGRPLLQNLIDYLKPKSLVLVLDNCEHLLDACAQLVVALLSACPNLRILATSRELLAIDGEQRYSVPSLALPNSKEPPPADKLVQYEALRLFIDRALLSQPSFTVTNQNAPVVAQICQRLDGIPFAIELAAGLVRSMSIEEIAQDLDDRFRLLTGGSRTALPRHKTLRATIDWSYDRLTEQEQVLLRRVSVFASGWTRETAEAVCSGEGIKKREVHFLLNTIVDKSLVVRPEGQARYRLLETIRQYSQEKLQESGEGEAVQTRHLDFFLKLAEQAELKLTGPEQREWLGRLDEEHDDLRTALRWSDETGEVERGLRLSGALWRFWEMRGYLTEGRQRLIAVLVQPQTSGSMGLRAKALNGAGMLAYRQGDYVVARSLYEEGLAIWQDVGDKQGIADSLNDLGNVANALGDYEAARARYEESIAAQRALDQKRGTAITLNNLGYLDYRHGHYETARALLEESLALFREIGAIRDSAFPLTGLGILALYQGENALARSLLQEGLTIRRELGDKRGIADSLNRMANVEHNLGNYAMARSDYEQGLKIFRELGDKQSIANSLNHLGSVSLSEGDYVSAHSLLAESLVIFQEVGGKRETARSLERFMNLAVAQGHAEWAARLLGAVEALRDTIQSPPAPSERADYDRCVSMTHANLGEERFTTLCTEGRAMTLEEAVGYALEKDASS
jgi:predicted ATPase/class 3 adenylate cyclase/Tfp pilus assembly protein PilF